MARLRRSLSILSAPWIFSAAKLTRSPKLMNRAAELDDYSLRPWHDAHVKGQTQGHGFGRYMIAAKLTAVTTAEGQAAIEKYMPLSKAQLLQDIVCSLVHDNKRGGFFVEVGVGNGTDLSNTYMLEKQLGWQGILAEPNRASHKSIAASRSAYLEKRAAYNKDGETVTFTEDVSDGDFSGISSHHSKNSGHTATTYDVSTVSLNTLLDERQAPSHIDFISIDTEGSELQILEGLALKKYQFGMLAIEHNYDRAKQAELDRRLTPHGYARIFKGISQFDAWYLHSSVKSKLLR